MESIEKEEFDQVKKNLELYTVFKELFGEEWINNKILNEEDRFEKHYLFWTLIDEHQSKFLANDLSIIKSDNQSKNAIISKMKKCSDKDSFDPFRSELIVFAYYKNKETEEFKVSYEPPVPDSERKNDVLITFKGEKHYLEIFTLTKDQIERNDHIIQTKVKAKINELENNPFVISFRLSRSFVEEEIEQLIEFIKVEIEKFKTEDSLEEREIEFLIEEINKGTIWLYKDKRIEKGFVGVMHSDIRELNNDSRIKNWILTKTEQVSASTKNILVTNLLALPSKLDNYYNGLIGQYSLRIDKYTHETTPFRKKNGAIYDERTKKFGGFIVFERGVYNSRKKHINPNSTNAITEEILELL